MCTSGLGESVSKMYVKKYVVIDVKLKESHSGVGNQKFEKLEFKFGIKKKIQKELDVAGLVVVFYDPLTCEPDFL